MASSTLPAVASVIESWSRPSHTPTSNVKELAQAVEICKQSLLHHAESFVRSIGDLPLLVSYSSDGTPMQSRKTVQAKLPSKKVRRTGRGSDELLVQNVFFRSLDASGQARTVVVMMDPLPLTHGKSAAAMFSCYRSFFPDPRSWGHRGVEVVHFASDRAAFTALRDLIFQFGQASTTRFVDDAFPNQHVLDLHHWFVGTPCALHDAHNALKWSLPQHFNDSNLTTDVHIGIEALRNSTDIIHGHLRGWLMKVVSFADPDSLPSEQELHTIWLALAVPVDTLDFLASTLRLHWDGEKLCLDGKCRERAGLLEELSGTILALWSFHSFSTSRWVTVGCACRSLICGWLSGLDHFVDYVSGLAGASHYHLGGYQRLRPHVRDFVVRCGMISYLPESILTCLLEDCRVARHIDMLKEEVHTELSWLSGLIPFVWERLATCSVSDGFGSLRSDVLHGALAAAGFLDQKVFRHADGHPWSLARGNIGDNITKLLPEACPEEPIAAKVWGLCTHGFNQEMVSQGLRLLLEVPWGTVAAEQQHASATIMKKHHKELTTETLRLRAFAHSMKHLFPDPPSANEKKVRQTMQKLEKLASKRPQNTGGRQVLLKELITIARFRQQHGRSYGPEVQKQLMRHHGCIWGKLPAAQREKFEQRALAFRSSKEQSLAEEMEALRTQLTLHQERLKRELETRGQGPVLLSACKLPSDVLVSWDSMAATVKFTAKNVSSLRSSCSQAPPLPSAVDHQLLRQHACPPRSRPDKPSWLRLVCKHREFFQHNIFEYAVDGVLFWGFVLYITQSPMNVVFASLKHVETVVRSWLPQGMDWETACLDTFAHRFELLSTSTYNWESLGAMDDNAIKVYNDVCHSPDNDLVTDDDGQLLSDIIHTQNLRAEDAQSRTERPVAPKPSKSHAHDLVQEHPWLAGFLEGGAGSASAPSSAPLSSNVIGQASGSGAPPAAASAELDDDAVDEVYAELEAKRMEWQDDGVLTQNWFKVTLLGGAWLRQQKGRSFDAFKGAASGGAVAEWCGKRGLQKSMRFEVTLYGEKGAAIMARAFYHRMSYFYGLCCELGELDHEFAAAEKASYVEPTELTEFASTLSGQAWQRVLQLRSLWP